MIGAYGATLGTRRPLYRLKRVTERGLGTPNNTELGLAVIWNNWKTMNGIYLEILIG